MLHWCCWRGQEQLDYSPFWQNRVWSDHHRLFRLRHFVYVCHVTCLMSGTNKKPLPLLLGARTLHIYIYILYIYSKYSVIIDIATFATPLCFFFFARRWMWPRISNWQVSRASVAWHRSIVVCGFNGGLMGFNGGLMGFNEDLWWFNGI